MNIFVCFMVDRKMSFESGIASESHGESLAADGVSLSAGSFRPNVDAMSNFDAASQLWMSGGNVDNAERRPWGEFSIWGSGSVSEMGGSIWNSGGGSLSTMFQHNAVEGLAGTKKAAGGNGDSAWCSAAEPNGSSTESLGFSDLRRDAKPWYGRFGVDSMSTESNSFRQFSDSGDGWGVASSAPAGSKSAPVDWDINKDGTVKADQSGGWPNVNVEGEQSGQHAQRSAWPDSGLNGAAHARSSSAVSDSSGKETDSTKLVTSSSAGSLEPVSSSTPQPNEPSPEDLMIAKMVNSNDGWGTRPVRQDTPWVIETSSPSASAVVGNVENVGGAAKPEVGSMWNTPKDVPSTGHYWGGSGPATSADWSNDSDIGVWVGPPSADAANPNMWTGAAAGWSAPNTASRLSSSDLAAALAGGLSDSVSGLQAAMANKLAMSTGADKSRLTDAQWLAALAKNQHGGGWAADPVASSWGTADAQDPAGALIRAQLQLAAQQPRLGPGGHQFEVRPPTAALKIDTWNEPPAVQDTLLHPGHWGQPPASASAVCHSLTFSSGWMVFTVRVKFTQCGDCSLAPVCNPILPAHQKV